MAITTERMLPVRGWKRLFIHQKVAVHGCDAGRLGWETSGHPGMRLGAGAPPMLVKNLQQNYVICSNRESPQGPSRQPRCYPPAPAPAVPLVPPCQPGFTGEPQGRRRLLARSGWRVSARPLGTAKTLERCGECLTKHLRFGVSKYGEHMFPHVPASPV